VSGGDVLLLTPGDVGRIRNYVRKKYASLPGERRAEIVADAVRRAIERQLPAFEDSLRRGLTNALIRCVVLEERRPVAASDVIGEMLRLDWRDPGRLRAIRDWASARLGAELDEQLLASIFAAAAGDGAQAWNGLREAASARAGSAAGVAAGIGPTPAAPAGGQASGVVVPFPVRPDRSDGPGQPDRPEHRRFRFLYAALAGLLAVGMTAYGLAAVNQDGETVPEAPPPVSGQVSGGDAPAPDTSLAEGNELPARLRWRPVDVEKLKAYLASRKSLLRHEPYFSAIMDAARAYDIHPLLLFAITGQEQGFVPEDHPQAETIANNPFNVYHSWQDFNTTTAHSAEIASRTIIRLSRDRPPEVDPVEWINREYAEDPLWHRGVNALFNSMEQYLSQDAEGAATNG